MKMKVEPNLMKSQGTTTPSITTLSITALSMMTFSITTINVIINKSDTEHNGSVVMLSGVFAECHL